MVESSFISGIGAVIGTILACLVVFPFSALIRDKLDLPYLLPSAGLIILLFLASVVITVIAGAAASAISSRRILKNDTGLILREGA